MLSRLKRLFSGSVTESSHGPSPVDDLEAGTGLPNKSSPDLLPAVADGRSGSAVPHAQSASGDSYFETMARMQAAISARQYDEAARLVRQNVSQIPSFVLTTQKEYGEFGIPSIPALEQGGTILALVRDRDGL